MVGKSVHHADTSPATSAGKMPGLEALARGFGAMTSGEHQKLEWAFPMGDAGYAFCRRTATA